MNNYNSRISSYTTILTVTVPGLLSYIVTIDVIYGCNKSLTKATASSVLYMWLYQIAWWLPSMMKHASNKITTTNCNYYSSRASPGTNYWIYMLHVCSYSLKFKYYNYYNLMHHIGISYFLQSYIVNYAMQVKHSLLYCTTVLYCISLMMSVHTSTCIQLMFAHVNYLLWHQECSVTQ